MSDACVCREIRYLSDEYADAVRLRDAVLRRPLGLVWTPEETAAEIGAVHLGCFSGDVLVGVLILTPQGSGRVRLRQMAVDPARQRGGIGSRLVAFAEIRAAELGYREIVAHARREAVAFYERLGYAVEGAEFVEVGIPHVEIRKRLGNGPAPGHSVRSDRSG